MLIIISVRLREEKDTEVRKGTHTNSLFIVLLQMWINTVGECTRCEP